MIETQFGLMFVFYFIAFTSLVGLFFVSCLLNFAKQRKREVGVALFSSTHSPFYFRLHKTTISDSIDVLIFCLEAARSTLSVFYILSLSSAITGAFFDGSATLPITAIHTPLFLFELFSFFFGLILSLILIGNLVPKLLATAHSASFMRVVIPCTSPFLIFLYPFTWLLFRLFKVTIFERAFVPFHVTTPKDKLMEALRDLEEAGFLSTHDQNLMQALFNFRDRIAREVMVPRVNLFAISSDLSIKEAIELLEKENYSRVPVYKDSIDNIVGVLMYKDLLLKYLKSESRLDEKIENLTKGVLYTPETKKISQLLQEFRKRQTHMAIVVDEYGGTAGCVTIEDILEEIVGEISDEYDQEAALFRPQGKGVWIVDARMNLLDLEEETGIKIPQEGEYDTVAGYVFYRLGTIPEKGWHIHHDEFEIEVLESCDRVVEKVKITTGRQK
jgi:putative hemolysin